METTEILDLPNSKDYVDANNWRRFANYIIDTFCFYIVIVAAIVVYITLQPDDAFYDENAAMTSGTGQLMEYLISFAVIIIYYSVQEYFLKGKTIGKYVTKTRAVTIDNGPLTFKKALGRSAARLIPFEAFSFFGSRPGGIHDRVADTRVILDTGWKA